MMDSHRSEKIAGMVRTLAATIALRIPPDVSVAPTVTRVRVSDDLSYADVYLMAVMKPEGAVKFLASAKGEMRKELAKKIQSHRVPVFRFHVDTEGEKASRVDELLRSL